MKLGLKLWSTNHLWFPEAVQRFQNKEFEFIELYAVPQSFNPSHLQILKEASIPINIHCSNEHQFNPMKKWQENFTIYQELILFADFFHSDYIIIHPGFGTDKEILFENLQKMNDLRVVFENVPFQPLKAPEPLYGYTFKMMQEILTKTKKRFCLDFTHAIKSATSQNINAKEFITQLMTLNPSVFHISDGNSTIEHDQHFNLGEGNFDLKFNKSYVLQCPEAFVVLETPKVNNTLENDIKNIKFFKEL